MNPKRTPIVATEAEYRKRIRIFLVKKLFVCWIRAPAMQNPQLDIRISCCVASRCILGDLTKMPVAEYLESKAAYAFAPIANRSVKLVIEPSISTALASSREPAVNIEVSNGFIASNLVTIK